ncbi:hypothetical protein, partial [Nocardioides sp.]|uniref:hypothetical protein n=1 Tax=Nocardioides sp. TaxID=35761 RepID=UPI00286D70A7
MARVLVLAIACTLGLVGVANPANAECTEATDLLGTKTVCVYTAQELQETAQSDPEAIYTVFQACFNGTSGEPEPCSNPRACSVGEA